MLKDELKRIKQKDLGKLDNRLFENMNKADNISSTLSHLSELQSFLIDQISLIQQGKANGPPKAEQITTMISKNYESMKESILRQSVIRQIKPDKIDISLFNEKMKNFKEEQANIKQSVTVLITQTKKQVYKIMNTVASTLMNQNEKLRNKFQNILAQKAQLIEINQSQIKQINELKRNCLEWESAKQRRKSRIVEKKNEPLNIPFISSQNQYKSFHEKLDMSMKVPIHQVNFKIQPTFSTFQAKSQLSPFAHFSSMGTSQVQAVAPQVPSLLKRNLSDFQNKTAKNSLIMGQPLFELQNMSCERRNTSLTRQKSNHEINRKQKAFISMNQQENMLIKFKGIPPIQSGVKRPSKQKIKMFSIM